MKKSTPSRLLFLVLVCVLATGCEKHNWEGLVYPKTGEMPFDLAIGHFATLEECRVAAKAVLAKTRPEEGAVPEYECGYRCTVSASPPAPGMLATRVCEETAK
jgi:hypothetical protein